MKELEGNIILITGATDGLGEKVATDFAALGATLLLHGRDPGKGRRVATSIRETTGSDRLHYYNADLSSLAEVEALADSIASDWRGVDVLINNAGVGAGPDPKRRDLSDDGFELRFAVNYLAPFLLTYRLLPLLRRRAEEVGEARVVNVASVAQQALDFDDLMLEQGYDGMRAYAQSKLALIMFSFDLAHEVAGTGITVNALHPASLMDTRMVREWFGTARTTVEEGARYLERLAVDDELHGKTGLYFDQGSPKRAAEQAYDDEARRRLRELSLKLISLRRQQFVGIQ
ncbi:SDR family NAD(P)-dependent oxidoreductase [Geomonas subterranea]|uniref:SDR family NAD(P)-dependent oxidoreductase n=1 Tax=Geomonas subterranea TaxID=2847989 RepID=A0ABX8LP72_9BACT|nr:MULTISPECIES: SDR family NAD(P)-dependent oxidoreductase [Geomonas]QXE92761.1 SDR family NAD(P)-dependent oxidoreductase [Geomonas subterranea]QXM09135.1 SDR family NAD(P)-dependent oxidoreductase [Geomonas subterranea]